MQWLQKVRPCFRQFHSKQSVKLGLTDSGRSFAGVRCSVELNYLLCLPTIRKLERGGDHPSKPHGSGYFAGSDFMSDRFASRLFVEMTGLHVDDRRSVEMKFFTSG